MANNKLICWKCGEPLKNIPLPLSRYSLCRSCGTELHACEMCYHYDSRRVNACREERAEPPVHRDTANFCDWFKPRFNAYRPSNEADKARSQLDSLFGGGSGAAEAFAPAKHKSEADKARDELERLFGGGEEKG